MRQATVKRKTTETDIRVELNLDGKGFGEIETGCGFFDHMLTLFASHGRFDLTLKCTGDMRVDAHHTVEDTGIALGQAFASALGDKKGIARYGSCALPMDESLILCAVDFSGRSCLVHKLNVPAEKVGDFDTELAKEFWLAFVRNAGCSLHFQQLAGENSHHILEGAFKAAAHSLRAAVASDPAYQGEIPSTKGTLG